MDVGDSFVDCGFVDDALKMAIWKSGAVRSDIKSTPKANCRM
jgi:hypothetical protein